MNRTMLATCLASFLASQPSTFAAPAITAQVQAKDIEAVLQASAAAWSRGDLDAFMASYEPSADVTYVGRSGLVRGFAAIRAAYASRFGTRGRMGQLSFRVLSDQPLGPDYALVTGRYALTRARADGGDAAGIFTLVFHHGDGGWRIMSDHTS